MSLLTNNNNITSITYRNAIYQGTIDQQQQTRKDFGIIYIAKQHQFICCNNWHNDFLQGQCLFFNHDKQYIYGTWINNLPQGFNVFKFGQVLFMAQFYRGKLVKNTRVLIIFQKYNIAAILIVINQPQKLDDLQLQLFAKSQVYTSQDVNKLFRQCQWPQQYFVQNQTLIKYISNKLTHIVTNRAPSHQNNKNSAKLRLIQNKYYRFGYDEGLAIVFDQDFNRVSVGCHSKTKLKSFGIAFNHKQKPYSQIKKPQQGKIIKIQPQNTQTLKAAIKNQIQRPQNISLNQNYKQNFLIGVNFCNKFYKNPSKLFAFYIENIISQNQIKNIISGSLTTRRLFQQSLQFSRIDQNQNNENQISYDAIDKKVNKIPTISPITHQQRKQTILDKQKLTNDRLRLQAIKKQIYDSLQKRKHNYQKKIMDDQYQRQIINRQLVGRNNYNTPQRTGEKSKSRKKIFQESQKNIKILRDFTPTRSQPNLTPLKTKMKNRIFNGQSSKVSLHQQKNDDTLGSTKGKNNNKKLYNNQYEENAQSQISQPRKDFSSNKYSNVKESRSNGKFRDVQYKNPGLTRQLQRSSSKNLKYNSFDGKKSISDSLNQTSKQHFQIGKNPKYVPINPHEQLQKKKSSQVKFSFKDIQPTFVQKSLKPSTFSSKNQQKYEQKNIPKSNYYLQQKSSSQFLKIRSRNQRSKQIDIDLQQSTKIKRFQHIKQNPAVQESPQFEYSKSKKQRQKNIKSNKLQIYNQDTFKQNTMPQQFQSIEQNEQTKNMQIIDQTRKSSFKHSNQVYLQQYQHKHSPNKSRQDNSKVFIRTAFQNSTNKNSSYKMLKQDSIHRPLRQGGSTYMQKHKVKKSIQKQIQKSPDRHRCYGKNGNNPYLQTPPGYSNDISYQNSFTKGGYKYQFESPQRSYRNQNTKPIRNPRGKLF